MGYHLNSEGEWKGDYYVMSLETARGLFLYREVKPSRLSAPKRVGRVFRAAGPTTFPLKEHFERVNQGIGHEGGRYEMEDRVLQPPPGPILRSAHPPGVDLEQQAPPLPPPTAPPGTGAPLDGIAEEPAMAPPQVGEAMASPAARPEILGKLDVKTNSHSK